MVNIVLNKNWKMRQVGAEKWWKANIPETLFSHLTPNNQFRVSSYKINELKSVNILDYDYEYMKFFDVNEEIFYCDKVILRFEKLSPLAEIYFNNKLFLTANNINMPCNIDITNSLKIVNNEIRIIFHSPSKFHERKYNSKLKLANSLQINSTRILGCIKLLVSNK